LPLFPFGNRSSVDLEGAISPLFVFRTYLATESRKDGALKDATTKAGGGAARIDTGENWCGLELTRAERG